MQRPKPTEPSLPRVVVVDDDPDLIDVLAALLTQEGYAVEGFTDATVALERLTAGLVPDLILLDCVMPHLDGGELADAITAAGVEAPIVLMTALSDPQFCVHVGERRV